MAELILQPLDRVDATFTPRRVDDLKGGAAQWIGWRGIWEASWLIEEDSGVPWVGEWHMMVVPPAPLNFIWAPSGDLTIHDIVET
jgi:hypothetical protein